MTPGARVQAAIDILAAVEAEWRGQGRPADGVIRHYFRSRRYAGSKDRAAVTGHVYAVLRQRAILLWRIQQAGIEFDADDRPRLLMLAMLASTAETDLSDLFDGGPHAPEPPSDAEQALVSAMKQAMPDQAPDWVRADVPEWLEGPLEASYGPDWVDIVRASDIRPPLDLRVNVLKTTREKARASLAKQDVDCRPTPMSPIGLRTDSHPQLAELDAFKSGRVDVQDEGSQLASLLVDAQPGMQVVDLCAGGGGKTLAIAAAMGGKGQVFACDIDVRRLKNLGPRLKKAAAHNVQVRTIERTRDPWLDSLAGQAHRVLVDAPCSGSGTWRRNPDLKWRLTPEQLDGYADTQRQLLDMAAKLTRPGGRIVYVTCSVFKQENESVVQRFLDGHDGFRSVPVGDVWAACIGGDCPADGDVLRLNARDHGTDGFFVAILERAG